MKLGNIDIKMKYILQEIKDRKGVVLAACQIMDRCNPNPCEHRGHCYQNSQEFFCDCSGTGYSGAVCHTRKYFSEIDKSGLDGV